MAELKTKPTEQDPKEFLMTIADEKKRQDSFKILEFLQQVTGFEPRMWGSSIIGYGSYHYKYADGQEGDWPLTGFSPRKQNLTIYITSGFDQYEELLKRLGKHSTGKSCLYIKKLEDIDLDVLAELVKQSVDHMIQTNA
ncbi:MAG: DUF1801 domain-containing protein [Chloroflexi bacterium]|nr:DUF1801 domain-containing protein [Chloroflexota bacterium]